VETNTILKRDTRLGETMTSVVTCPNGHSFPVNPNKHSNRNYRLCPHRGCNAKVVIKKRFRFLPNSNWPEQKLKQQADRVWSKEMGKQGQKQKQPAMAFDARQLPFVNVFLASLAAKKQMEEEEKRKNAPAEG